MFLKMMQAMVITTVAEISIRVEDFYIYKLKPLPILPILDGLVKARRKGRHY